MWWCWKHGKLDCQQYLYQFSSNRLFYFNKQWSLTYQLLMWVERAKAPILERTFCFNYNYYFILTTYSIFFSRLWGQFHQATRQSDKWNEDSHHWNRQVYSHKTCTFCSLAKEIQENLYFKFWGNILSSSCSLSWIYSFKC